MKKQSERMEGAGVQLGFELEFTPIDPSGPSSSPAAIVSEASVKGSVVDLTPLLQRRAAENDRALIKAVQSRAAHLSDCLRK